jgi:hypothetical protein
MGIGHDGRRSTGGVRRSGFKKPHGDEPLGRTAQVFSGRDVARDNGVGIMSMACVSTGDLAEADMGYLLIACKGVGVERQRRFQTMGAVDGAVERWRKEGFESWWLFAPRKDRDAGRRLMRAWRNR